MLSSLRGRFALILIVVASSGWQLYSKGLKQGLDLQGGMHLVLEGDEPDSTLTTAARADATSSNHGMNSSPSRPPSSTTRSAASTMRVRDSPLLMSTLSLPTEDLHCKLTV